MAQLSTYNVYQQRLFRFLQDYHLYKFEDDEQETIDFIVSRSDLAKEAYKIASYAGKAALECEDAALETLYADLHFSPITYLIEAYIDLYGIELDKAEACQIYKNPTVRKIFAKYGSDIEGDPKEELLIDELTPFMGKYRLEVSTFDRTPHLLSL